MSEYEFTFVLDGMGPDDHDAVQSLTEELDALVSGSYGVHRLTVAAEGANAVTAAETVVAKVAEIVPEMRLLRLDRDLVGVSDIAERTDRTRQNVTQWIRGQRREGVPFPVPEAVVGRSQVWLWSEVNEWLRGIGLDDGEQRPTRTEMTEIDWLLQKHMSVELELVTASDRDDVAQTAGKLSEHARSSPRFIDYLVRHAQVRGPDGRYTIFVCSPDDQAVDVFRRLERFPHPVVLATVTPDIHAMVMANGPGRSEETHEIEKGMAVRDWLDLIALYPDGEFVIATENDTTTIAPTSPLNLTYV